MIELDVRGAAVPQQPSELHPPHLRQTRAQRGLPYQRFGRQGPISWDHQSRPAARVWLLGRGRFREGSSSPGGWCQSAGRNGTHGDCERTNDPPRSTNQGEWKGIRNSPHGSNHASHGHSNPPPHNRHCPNARSKALAGLAARFKGRTVFLGPSIAASCTRLVAW